MLHPRDPAATVWDCGGWGNLAVIEDGRAATRSLPTWLTGLLTLAITGAVLWRVLLPAITLDGDSSRYLNAGLNLAQHGVFTAASYDPAVMPAPGLTHGGPLTAAEIALASLHDQTHDYFRCLLAAGKLGVPCAGSALGIQLLYVVEICIFLFAVFHIARLLGLVPLTAWYTVFAAMLCRELWRYTGYILTEPLFLMTAGLFLWSWLAAWLAPTRRLLWLLAGLALALCMLVKPAWNGLLPLLLLLLAWTGWRRPDLRPQQFRNMLLLVLGYALLAGPFLLRNGLVLGHWSLSDPGYLIASLSHRLAFNMMTWDECLTGLLHYLPDFGDSLARRLLGPEAGLRIGWDAASYYIHGRDVVHPGVRHMEAGAALYRLLADYVMSDPFKNAAVTLLLAWRGLFVGGKWALLALLLAWPVLMRQASPDLSRRWLILLLPALGMLLLNAQASVSLQRYNLALIPAFAVILALLVQGLVATVKTFLPKLRWQSLSSAQLNGKTARS